MSRFEDLSHKEIAIKMNISQKTVEKHVGQALKKLKAKNHGLDASLIVLMGLLEIYRL